MPKIRVSFQGFENPAIAAIQARGDVHHGIRQIRPAQNNHSIGLLQQMRCALLRGPGQVVKDETTAGFLAQLVHQPRFAYVPRRTITQVHEIRHAVSLDQVVDEPGCLPVGREQGLAGDGQTSKHETSGETQR